MIDFEYGQSPIYTKGQSPIYTPSVDTFDLGTFLNRNFERQLDEELFEAKLTKIRNFLEIFIVKNQNDLVNMLDYDRNELRLSSYLPYNIEYHDKTVIDPDYWGILSKNLSLRLNCDIVTEINWVREYDPCGSKKFLEARIIIKC